MAALQISEEIFPAAGHLLVLPFHAANWIISHDNPPTLLCCYQSDKMMGWWEKHNVTWCWTEVSRAQSWGGASMSLFWHVWGDPPAVCLPSPIHTGTVFEQMYSGDVLPGDREREVTLLWCLLTPICPEASYTQVFILCVDSGLQ